MIELVTLWTHHNSSFDIQSADLVIAPTRGTHWKVERGYADALRKLQKILGTTQFLWCVTSQKQWWTRTSKGKDLVRWELKLPASQIIRLIDDQVWERILKGNREESDSLFVDRIGVNTSALVKFPIEPSWATRHEIEPRYK